MAQNKKADITLNNLKLSTKFVLGFVLMFITMALLMGFIVVQVNTLQRLSNDLGHGLIPTLVVSQEMTQEAGASLNSITEYINSGQKEHLSEWENNYKAVKGTGQNFLDHFDSGAALQDIRASGASILNELDKLNLSMKKFPQDTTDSFQADLQKLGQGSMQLIASLEESQHAKGGSLEYWVAIAEINRRLALLWEAMAHKDISCLKSWGGGAGSLGLGKLGEQGNVAAIFAELDTLKGRAITIGSHYAAARAELKASRQHIYKLLAELNVEARELTRVAMERGDRASRSIFITIALGLLLALIITVVLLCLLLHTTVRPLNGIIAHFTRGSEKLTNTAGHLSQSSQTLFHGVSENTAAVLEAINSLEEMLNLAKRNANHSSEAQSLMEQAKGHVGQANGAMGEISLAMEEIRVSGEASRQIIKTVQKIAFQTNILALNAAVESARAGEAGLGFAVVADEVRNLANNSSEAAKNTSVLIASIGDHISKGTRLVHNAEDSFASMVATSEQMGGLIGEIAQASQSQVMDIQNIHQSIAMMDKVTQENAAGAGETNSISASLTRQAALLDGSLAEMTRILQGSTEARQAQKVVALPPPKKIRRGDGKEQLATPENVSVPKAQLDDLIPMDEDF